MTFIDKYFISTIDGKYKCIKNVKIGEFVMTISTENETKQYKISCLGTCLGASIGSCIGSGIGLISGVFLGSIIGSCIGSYLGSYMGFCLISKINLYQLSEVEEIIKSEVTTVSELCKKIYLSSCEKIYTQFSSLFFKNTKKSKNIKNIEDSEIIEIIKISDSI